MSLQIELGNKDEFQVMSGTKESFELKYLDKKY
jgi:hypothetical protein